MCPHEIVGALPPIFGAPFYFLDKRCVFDLGGGAAPSGPPKPAYRLVACPPLLHAALGWAEPLLTPSWVRWGALPLGVAILPLATTAQGAFGFSKPLPLGPELGQWARPFFASSF